jgi:hypothetical protein
MTRLVEQEHGRIVEEDDIVPPPLYDGVHPQIVTADTVRQGPLGKPVLWVLLTAVTLAVVGLLIAWALSGAPPAT